TAALYVNSGAKFVVGPSYNEAIVRFCNRRGVLYCPGCATETEILAAMEFGCDLVKDFEGKSNGGSGFAKAVLGPTSWVQLMITGGVKATWESIEDWFKNGKVAAVGIGGDIVNNKVLELLNLEEFIAAKTAEVLAWIRKARGVPLFLGVEHVGIYPFGGAFAVQIADWYSTNFGFTMQDGKSSTFVSGPGAGRLEIMKAGETDRCHIAILVSDFEAAAAFLKERGVALEEPKIKPDVKAVFLKNPDPAGNRVHLLWRQ
ncbi:MAG: hypothetical protein Q8N81_03525, partial [bacterium]|nr:hypothetical protein [bacterium]